MTSLQLERVTFTGADDRTDLDVLASLASAHPWVEFAVLHSPSQSSTGRYPSLAWRNRFYRSSVPVAQRALHLCGSAVTAFLTDQSGVCDELDHVHRVQLNFTIENLERELLLSLPHVLSAWYESDPQIVFILQLNKVNQSLPEVFSGYRWPNLQFLVDSSGGRGVSPTVWPEPLAAFPTAYAGGIGPGTIRETLTRLAQVTRSTGIDMESRVRTNDTFDLAKVQAVIEEVLAECEAGEADAGRPSLTFHA